MPSDGPFGGQHRDGAWRGGGGGSRGRVRHLGERLPTLGAPGWSGRDAEWLVLVCLHGGVFLRPQYLAFLGRSHPELARRFVRRCGKAAVEERRNASGLKLCRIVDRHLYRALRVEHFRPRRDATPAVALGRLLALDYVSTTSTRRGCRPAARKVAAFTAAGVPRALWPGRVHAGTNGARRLPFIHRLPLALGAELWEVATAAGGGAEVDRERVIGRIKFRRAWLTSHGLAASDCRIIQVLGESMEPTLVDGCSILVNHAARRRRKGGIYVVRTADGLIVKRDGKEADGSWLLVSDNPDKRAWPTLSWPADAAVLGEVRWTARTFLT